MTMSTTRHVLYLEDDPEDGLLLRMLLEGVRAPRYEVTVCDSADSAMLALSMQAYDAVFCDYVLRSEDGVQTASFFIEQVLEHFPMLPLIVTSGAERGALDGQLQARIGDGRVGYLHKSAWREETLVRKIDAVQSMLERVRRLPGHSEPLAAEIAAQQERQHRGMSA